MLDSSTYYQGLSEIGRGLHPLQDIDAHKDQGINKVGKIDSPHGEGWLNYFNPFAFGGHWDDTNWDAINGVWRKVGAEQNKRLQRTKDKTNMYLEEAKHWSVLNEGRGCYWSK